MTQPRSPRVLVEPAAWLLAGLLLALAASAGLERWLGGFDQVRSSTGAWILAHVHWVRFAGDYKAAAAVSLVPNTTYDPLFPALLLALAGPDSDLLVLGHRLAAASAGLALLPLVALWRRIGGWSVAPVAALALLFPPFLATAGLVRYDSLAIALGLLAVATAARAVDQGGSAWLLAGVACGLTYLAREFLVGPALAATGTAWVIASLRDRTLEAVLGPLVLVALGLLLGAVPLPLSLGLSPWGGLDALAGYGGRAQEGSALPLERLLYLRLLALPLALGALGWLLALWRARQRSAVLVGLAALGSFGFFLLSRQQSPQYYLLGHLLLLSGAAGWALLLPRWPLRLALALALAWPVVHQARALTPRLLQADHDQHPVLHSEGWPARPDEPARLVAQAVEWVGQRPLLVASFRVENADALVPILHDRPAAFVFANWTERVPEIVSLYDGEPVWYLSIEGRESPHGLPQGAVVVESWQTRHLSARLAMLPGRQAQAGVDLCRNGGPVRGACMQQAWLERGEHGLRAWILEQGARFDQRLTASTRWW